MKNHLRLSRRQMLAGGIGLGVLTAGGVYVATGEPYDFFNAMLHHELPGVKFSDATVRAYTTDAMQGRNPDFYVKFETLLRIYRVIGYGGIMEVLGSSWAFERFRRDMLSQFLFNTDFFDLADPRAKELTYDDTPRACGRFAQLGY